MNFLLFFLFTFLSSICDDEVTIIDLKETHSIKQEHEPLQLGYSVEGDNTYITKNIIKFLKLGDQLEFRQVACFKNVNSKTISKLSQYNILFYIIFTETQESFAWKLYEVNTGTFLSGKQYNSSKINDKLLRTITSDIWEDLFAEDAPTNYLLTYIEKKQNSVGNNYNIIITSPIAQMFNKNLVSSSTPLVDLGVLDTEPHQSLALSQATSKNVRILKLTSDGSLVKLVDLPGTSTSVSSYEKGIIYIRSGKIYCCYFDEKEKGFVHAVCKKNDTSLYGAVVVTNDKSLLYIRDFALFKCSYTLDKSGALTCGKEIKISSKNCTVASFSYCRLTKEIVVSEKIQDVFQLFIYDIQTMKKNRITSSFIHKQDPSFSPSGSWISYVAFDEKKNERYVEMINVYTKKNVRITDTPGCYVSPTWIRKI
jgi:hypothetical protein